jgi:DNA-binding transcriptional MerR regulator
MTIEGEYYTIREMADILDLKFETTKQRLLTAGIEPAKLVSGVRLYSPDALEKIRVVRRKGRPLKGEERKEVEDGT